MSRLVMWSAHADQGRVWCWGSDRYSELGQGRSLRADQPVRVAGVGPR